MNTNNLNWLINWHLRILSRNEHRGNWIQINTLDNPGWNFQTSLSGTGLENHQFKESYIDRTEDDWVYCYIKDGFFLAPCGPLNLLEALQTFRDWVDSLEPVILANEFFERDNLDWIMKWYAGQCDGYWEHLHGLCFLTTDEPSWSMRFGIEETELDDINFPSVAIKRSETDWINCFVKYKIFEGRCSIQNLNEMLEIFRDWAENAQ